MKKKIIKASLITLSVFFTLLVVLVVHIYIVTRHKPYTNQTQLSRIDFKEKVDSTEAIKIKSYVAHLSGVQHVYFNIPDGILIYGYVVGKQNSTDVYNSLMAFGHYNAVRYVVDASSVAKGCPVFDKNSFSYRFSHLISNAFN